MENSKTRKRAALREIENFCEKKKRDEVGAKINEFNEEGKTIKNEVKAVKAVRELEREVKDVVALVGQEPLVPFADADANANSDPQLVSIYDSDIYVYLARLSEKHPVLAMSSVSVSRRKARKILIDWIVEVQLQFSLLQETLFLSVNIMDRFLQSRLVPRRQLQLVGVTAMLIAVKRAC
jgi:hypothetical protein